MIYEYCGVKYPEYLKHGNACQFIAPAALHFCKGNGLDVGASKWPLPGAIPIDLVYGGDALNLPAGEYDYIFSSHALEHIPNYVAAVEHWKTRLRPGGVLFTYLPHPSMKYWTPARCRKHLHLFHPEDMQTTFEDVGFVNVLRSERDMYWSFACVGFKPA